MSFYKFEPEDIIHSKIVTHPSFIVEKNGIDISGSVFLEKKYLNDSLYNRRVEGYSDKEGGFIATQYPLSSSIEIIDAEDGATNELVYHSILNLYNYYNFYNPNYTAYVTGALPTRFRVISVPEIYYDREILTGTFTASDLDSSGDVRVLYDDGRGGIYSGSDTSNLVGNIFYSEGIVVLKAGGLNDEAGLNDFGEASPTDFKWKISFKGTQTIPVKLFRCRAKAGELNASTNPSYYTIFTSSDALYPNQKEIVMDPPCTYITTIGLYNEEYELVGLAKLAQPIKKETGQNSIDINFRVRLDF